MTLSITFKAEEITFFACHTERFILNLFFLAVIISSNDTIFSLYTWMYFLHINIFPLLTFLSEADTENMLGGSIAKKL